MAIGCASVEAGLGAKEGPLLTPPSIFESVLRGIVNRCPLSFWGCNPPPPFWAPKVRLSNGLFQQITTASKHQAYKPASNTATTVATTKLLTSDAAIPCNNAKKTKLSQSFVEGWCREDRLDHLHATRDCFRSNKRGKECTLHFVVLIPQIYSSPILIVGFG